MGLGDGMGSRFRVRACDRVRHGIGLELEHGMGLGHRIRA